MTVQASAAALVVESDSVIEVCAVPPASADEHLAIPAYGPCIDRLDVQRGPESASVAHQWDLSFKNRSQDAVDSPL